MNPIQFINSQLSSFPALQPTSLNTIHKKVLAVVLVALTFLAACYLAYRHYILNGVKQEKKNQKKLPPPQPAQPDAIKIDTKHGKVAQSVQVEDAFIEKEKDFHLNGEPILEEDKNPVLKNKTPSPAEAKAIKELILKLIKEKNKFFDREPTDCILRDFLRDVNDPTIDFSELSMAEWQNLLGGKLTENQAVYFFEKSIVRKYSYLFCPLMHMLINGQLFSLSTTQENLQLVKRLHMIGRETMPSGLTHAYEDYFVRALTQPQAEYTAFYHLIQHDPYLVNVFFNTAERVCRTKDKQIPTDRLLSPLSHVNEKGKLIYFERFLKSCDRHENADTWDYFGKALVSLDSQIEKELALLVAIQTKTPGKTCRQWIRSLDYDQSKEHKKRILEVIIPTLTLDDILSFEEMFGENYYFIGNRYEMEDQILRSLTEDQYITLIQYWQTHLSSDETYKRIARLFSDLYFVGRKNTIEQILQTYPTIKLKKLIGLFETHEHKQTYFLVLSTLNTLKRLNENSRDIKTAKMLTTLVLIPHCADHTRHARFARLLAESCSTEQIQPIIAGFKAFLSINNRSVPGCTLGESFLSFLTTLLQNGDLKKIKTAFEAYWNCWEQFDQESTGCSAVILPYIQSEEVLKTVYEAIYCYFPPKKKLAIHNLLRGNVLYNGQNYRVNLAQDIIDRIIV